MEMSAADEIVRRVKEMNQNDLNKGYVIFPMGDAGMLRDWFAGMALQTGVVIKNADVQMAQKRGDPQERIVAQWCYQMADAMLAEREKRTVYKESCPKCGHLKAREINDNSGRRIVCADCGVLWR